MNFLKRLVIFLLLALFTYEVRIKKTSKVSKTNSQDCYNTIKDCKEHAKKVYSHCDSFIDYEGVEWFCIFLGGNGSCHWWEEDCEKEYNSIINQCDKPVEYFSAGSDRIHYCFNK